MASAETRQALHEKRSAIADRIKEGGYATQQGAAKFIMPPHAESSPLEDPKTQEEILSPPTVKATIGGEPVEIHELSAKQARMLAGFLEGPLVDMFGTRAEGDSVMALSRRLSGIIAGTSKYNTGILPYIVRSLKPAGETVEAEIPARAAEIDEEMRYEELTEVLALIFQKNRTLESLTHGPPRKNG